MIVELVQYLTTPCSWQARKWGYLSESIGIGARYRRCQKQWQPHLYKTQESIVRFLKLHQEIRSVLFCGSGAGFDIPWSSLELQALDRIILLDLVHPWEIRWRALNNSKIEYHTVDLSGVMDQLESGEVFPDPKVNWDGRVDLVVSLNLLSQLPLFPLERMHKSLPGAPEVELHGWARRIQRSHLDLISRWGRNQLVISDLEERWQDRNGERIESQDPWYGAKWFEPEEVWEWEISPLGEINHDRLKIHRVGFSSSLPIIPPDGFSPVEAE